MSPNKNIYLLLLLFWLSQSCIQDDIIFDTVPETLRISNRIDTLRLGDTVQLETRYTNNIGELETPPLQWLSSAPEIAEINNEGQLIGRAEGTAELIVTTNPNNTTVAIADTLSLVVKADGNTSSGTQIRAGNIRTTSSYVLTGDFTLMQQDGELLIAFADNYAASRSLPGLYVYLTNNPNSVANALEIGKVEVFEGVHLYRLENVDIADYDYLFYYCKPFRVKVGDGTIN